VIAPMFSSSPLAAVACNLFNYTFTGPEPAEQYEWFLVLFKAGTADIIGQIATVPFTFAP